MKVNLNISKLWFGLLFTGMAGFFLTLVFPAPQGFYAFTALAALLGLIVSINIHVAKRKDKQLVCPVGSNCNAVINSRYSKFFGFSLEYLGLAYFGFVFIAYTALALAPNLLTEITLIGLMALSAMAFLFSTYLIFVQAFLLRQWCIWCILASAFSYTIFLISLINLDIAVNFLMNIENTILMLQLLGFSIGVGAATSGIFTFYRFLKDLDIDAKETDALKGISEIVWVGLSLVILGHLAMYVAYPDALSDSALFLSRIISVFVATFSGAALMVIFAPFLEYIPFGEKPEKHKPSKLETLRRPVFVLGSIAISSWYFAFTTYFLPDYAISKLLAIYGFFVVVSMIIALAWEDYLSKKSLHKE